MGQNLRNGVKEDPLYSMQVQEDAMSKPRTVPVTDPDATNPQNRRQKEEQQPNEPLPGSKEVKNRNHSRQNHGEG
jgi:small acid-soluble spore protein P (minor)